MALGTLALGMAPFAPSLTLSDEESSKRCPLTPAEVAQRPKAHSDIRSPRIFRAERPDPPAPEAGESEEPDDEAPDELEEPEDPDQPDELDEPGQADVTATAALAESVASR